MALITASLNSLSVLSDYQRRLLSIEWWQPFVWEFSSQLSILLLVPVFIWVDQKRPFSLGKIKASMVQFVAMSIAFSLAHVVIMVAMRHACYWTLNASYNFGPWGQELLYEYRKDTMTFLRIVLTIYAYRFIVSRLNSEASIIEEGEDKKQPDYVTRFIVKKLGKEFIVPVKDIDWIEASGNYMNLHVGERCYPLRETMSDLVARLDPTQFARIHRSYVVKLSLIKQIVPQPSGDHTVELSNGKNFKLSRKYREALLKGPNDSQSMKI